MFFSTAFAIFLVPALFVIVERLAHVRQGEKPGVAPTEQKQPPQVSAVPTADRAAKGG
jgi:hypothetical protein